MIKKEFIEALKDVPDDAQMGFVLNNMFYIYPHTNWVYWEPLMGLNDVPFSVCTLHFDDRGNAE